MKMSQPILFHLTIAVLFALSGCASAPSGNSALLRIFPTTRVLPANHLKFYIHFVEPMEQGEIFRHLRLLRADNSEAIGSFRETELWTPDGRRLTLWLHPGRQKSKVNLNIDEGPVLLPDKQYTLEISGEWKTQSGVPLGKTARHTFQCIAPDTMQPDPDRWKMAIPTEGSAEPLRIHFGESLDWALLQSEIKLVSVEGQPVIGKIRIGEQETSWEFQPEASWKRGPYEVRLGSVLEDLAGNNLERPFEVDLSQPSSGSFRKPTRLPFVIPKRATASPDPCSPLPGQVRR